MKISNPYASSYSMYNQLMEVMARLNTVEKESRQEISHLNNEISVLKKETQPIPTAEGKKRDVKPVDRRGIREPP